ncbi:MAG: hypothetical protein PVG25_06380 [Anaerolineae bacterium]|jgi:hypothetical protein
MAPSIQYASYLVRLWREVDTGQHHTAADWQGEIEHIQTGERWAFSTLNTLLDFLRQGAANVEEMQIPGASRPGSLEEGWNR